VAEHVLSVKGAADVDVSEPVAQFVVE